MEPQTDFAQQEKNNYKLNIDMYDIKKAAMILRALNHKLRQDLIKTIHENKSTTVTQLYLRLGIEQSVASQQLSILRKAGIITVLRISKHRYYSINPDRIEEIKKFAKNLVSDHHLR